MHHIDFEYNGTKDIVRVIKNLIVIMERNELVKHSVTDGIRHSWLVLGEGSIKQMREVYMSVFGEEVNPTTANIYTKRLLDKGTLQKERRGYYKMHPALAEVPKPPYVVATPVPDAPDAWCGTCFSHYPQGTPCPTCHPPSPPVTLCTNCGTVHNVGTSCPVCSTQPVCATHGQ